MPFYCSQGEIPAKRHTAFKNNKGDIYYEALVSRQGFSSMFSNYYLSSLYPVINYQLLIKICYKGTYQKRGKIMDNKKNPKGELVNAEEFDYLLKLQGYESSLFP